VLPARDTVTSHARARQRGRALLRANVLEAASRLLVHTGPEALTVRRLAHELDCSTKVVYTLFSGKDGVAEALYLEGCQRLRRAVGRVAVADEPLTYLDGVAQAYWRFALANPSYYAVMFGGAIPNFRPKMSALQETANAFVAVVNVIGEYADSGALVVADPGVLVKRLWAPLHGVVSLHLLGHFATRAEAEYVYRTTLRALLETLRTERH